MLYKRPHETWFNKGIKAVEGGLKIYGTAQGLYQAGSAIASAARTGYQIASPMLALL